MNKKVLLITFYDASNYGAFLQAYSTVKFLEQQNIEVHVKRHNANSDHLLFKLYVFLKGNKLSCEATAYKKQIREKIASCKTFFNIQCGRNCTYDVAVLGSDEIWNVRNISALHYPFFFCGVKNAKKNIAYAVCAGNVSKGDLKLFPYTIPGIKNLNAVSVRDDNTEILMKSLDIKNAIRVLDPTFLVDFTSKITDVEYNKYLFVYTYGLDEKTVNEIRKYANNNKMSIVATGSYCSWADYNPVPDPFEWISLIKHSEYVVTTTFHGTVLAIQQNKQFAVVGTCSAKIASVLKELQLENRMVMLNASLDAVFDIQIDYSNLNIKMEELKKKSRDFLLSQLD